jgi:hypothetical protein
MRERDRAEMRRDEIRTEDVIERAVRLAQKMRIQLELLAIKVKEEQ